MGGFCFSITRTCTGEVWVRSTWRAAVRLRRDIESVLHLARRMVGRDVQLGEIVIVIFHVRAFGDGKAQVGEDGGDFVQHLGDGMHAAGCSRAARGRVTSRVSDLQPRVQRRVGQLGLARGDGFGDGVAQAVEQRGPGPCVRPGSWRPGFQQFADRAFLAQARPRARLPARLRRRRRRSAARISD